MPELTLPEQLQRAASEFPLLGITYVQEDGSTQQQSYPELLEEAGLLAGGLQQSGLKKGDKAIIATEDNRQTITLVWACFLAGVIPTILQPPVSFTDLNPAASKIRNVFRQLENPLVFLSGQAHAPDHSNSPSDQLAVQIRYYHDLPKASPVNLELPALDDLAFIQFSSGSTGEPKGIMLTHRNLVSNIHDIIRGIDLQPIDHGGNWMPLYHDMGLIGYHLTPIFCPCNQYHVDTVDFIKNPGLWLDMISKFHITVTGCPNFGQALVLRYMKRRSEGRKWDFSSVKCLLNGAEPIAVKIMKEFMNGMAEYGFRKEAMMPVYGMAESTLAISFSPLHEPPLVTSFDGATLDNEQKAVRHTATKNVHQRSIISVGKPLQEIQIRIVDEKGTELPENTVGHIQVRGDAVTSGYFQQAEATYHVFDKGWLRTGDMGFIFEGNLYISGRFKDIIFMNGRNFFAHDLENLASTLEEVNYGKIVIGGITDPKSGKEKVLLFLAGIPESGATEMLHTLRTLFRKNMGIHLDEMILIRSNEIPKTSSGKIQRYKLIQRYLQDGFRESRHR